MERGDDNPEQVASWLRLVRASVSPRVVWAISGTAALLTLAIVCTLLLVRRHTLETWAFESALDYLRRTPPTDLILAQLPPERFASVRERGLRIVARLFVPTLCAGGVAALAAAGAYAFAARRLRPIFRTLIVPRKASPPLRHESWLIFGAIALLAMFVHAPYASQSIRWDEDQASVFASSSWFAWANNITGWGNHVAALLTIRLATAAFGIHELSVRMPAMIASSLALALLCAYLWRRYSPWLACVSAALCLALPIWAEQTALARGYGLSFGAGALLALGLLRLHDENGEVSSETMWCLFAAMLIGCLAHFFFVFMAAGVFGVIYFSNRLRQQRQLRAALIWWLILACILPGLSLALGAPATIAMQIDIVPIEFAVVLRRFTTELAFRHIGALGTTLAILSASALATAALLLPSAARGAYSGIALATLLGPLAFKPVYLYPRFFLHALPLLVTSVAWFVSIRVLRNRALPNLVAIAAIAALGISTRPWEVTPQVDLRSAAAIARIESRAHGERFAIDTFMATGVRFYNGPLGRVVNVDHPLPSDLERFLLAVAHEDERARVPKGFEIERRVPGAEYDVLLLQRRGASPP